MRGNGEKRDQPGARGGEGNGPWVTSHPGRKEGGLTRKRLLREAPCELRRRGLVGWRRVSCELSVCYGRVLFSQLPLSFVDRPGPPCPSAR
ncbi:unnamed protein product [Caretta caretta]